MAEVYAGAVQSLLAWSKGVAANPGVELQQLSDDQIENHQRENADDCHRDKIA
jgi:hypothetical protein